MVFQELTDLEVKLRRRDLESIKALLPPDFDSTQDLYKPHGKYEYCLGKRIRNHGGGQHLGGSAYIQKASIEGQEITYISKTWNLWENWTEFYTELFLLAHPKFLRPLQGDCVPYLFGAHNIPNGRIIFDMELPHPVRWRCATPNISIKLKEAIVDAYQKIHEQGVLHDNVAFRHMLISDDDRITIIDFSRSRCLDSDQDLRIKTCQLSELEDEMRKVKFWLDYPNARNTERSMSAKACHRSTPKSSNSIGDNSRSVPYAPFTSKTIEGWDTAVSDTTEMRYEVSVDRRSRSWSVPTDCKVLPRRMVATSQNPRHAVNPTVAGASQDPATVITDSVVSSSGPPQSSMAGGGGLLSRMFSFQRLIPSTAHTSVSIDSSTEKRAHTEEDDAKATPKKAKTVVFHPDTSDNSVWATGREMPRSRVTGRPPTPYYPHDTNLPSTSADDQTLPSFSESQNVMPMPWLPPGTDPLSVSESPLPSTTPSTSGGRGGAAPPPAIRIPYSIIICGPPEVGSRTWMVTPEVFGRVGGYLDGLNGAHRVPGHLSDVSTAGLSVQRLATPSVPTPPVSARRPTSRGLPAKISPQTPTAPVEGQYYFPPRRPRNGSVTSVLPSAEKPLKHAPAVVMGGNECDAAPSQLLPTSVLSHSRRLSDDDVEGSITPEPKAAVEKSVSKQAGKRKVLQERESVPLLRSKRIALRQATPVTEGGLVDARKRKRHE